MKALRLHGPNDLRFEEMETPKPKKGEVLIKVSFSPINPSDLAFLTGMYGIQKDYPVVPGFEASGVVIESGGGMYANYLKGKRVSCVAANHLDGTWAEYMVTDATSCVTIGNKIPLEQGCMSFVNPLTAIDFIKIAKKGNYDAMVFSAAGSALAKITHAMAKEEGIAFAGLVRSDSQVDKLNLWGVDLALNTNSDNWQKELKSWSKNHRKILFPDAIGGSKIPSKILSCLPPGSKMLIYGSLDFENPGMYIPREFIFKEYEISGYWLSRSAKRKGFITSLQESRKVQKLYANGFTNDIQLRSNLKDFGKAIEAYSKGMSKGKVLFSM